VPRRSAGIVLYRIREGGPEVLLVHPGGPFWSRRDEGAWSIPKGEHDEDEDPLTCALREFEEELGTRPPTRPPNRPPTPLPPTTAPVELGTVRQRGGKLVSAWAVEGDLDVGGVRSNTFELEWPPRSGVRREFPEIDRAEWFALEPAREKILAAQAELLDRLAAHLAGQPPGG
jgi:predicted NUDIX family NTP pyrophosphohydrolase